MCTLIVSLDVAAKWPALFLMVRDEVLDRPWSIPARHWPQYPQLYGGRDDEQGGTWCAVNVEDRRIAGVLNAGKADHSTRSRGELPLIAASQTALSDDLSGYAPFILVNVDLKTGLNVQTWDGHQLTAQEHREGTHLIVNTGVNNQHPRAVQLRSQLEAIRWTGPTDDEPLTAWKPWLTLLEQPHLPRSSRTAVIRRRRLVTGEPQGSSSVSLSAMSDERTRYDFIRLGTPPLPISEATTIF